MPYRSSTDRVRGTMDHGRSPGWRWDEWRRNTFTGSPREGKSLMALRKFLILRNPQSGCLGTNGPAIDAGRAHPGEEAAVMGRIASEPRPVALRKIQQHNPGTFRADGSSGEGR